MKNKKRNIAIISAIIIIVAITTGVIIWLFAIKTQMPVQQITTQALSLPQQQQPTPAPQAVQNQQQSVLPIINLNKFTEEEAGKKINHIAVEYKKNISDDKKTIHEFTYESVPSSDRTYEISHLSQNYLVITRCGGLAPCSDYLFNLKDLSQVNFQFPTILGKVLFFENEKYVTVSGPGRYEQPGIAIEIIDGKKVYCLISSEDISGVSISNGTMSFMEDVLVEDNDGVGRDIVTKKEIDIVNFCKSK